MFSKPSSRRTLQNAALAIFSLLIGLGLIEGAFRLAGPRDLNVSLYWRFDSAYGWTIDPAVQGIAPVTAAGFRHRPVAVPKPAGTRRLLVLGDSFSQATGIPYGKTFPGVFERRLNREAYGEAWEVINLGVGDWGTGQQLIALREHGLAFDPDIVVLQVFPFNDLCNNSIALAETCSMQDHHRPYVEVFDDDVRVRHLSAWRAWLRSRLVAFGVLENRLALSRQVGLSQASGDFGDLSRRRNDFFKENAARIGLPYLGAMASLVPPDEQPPVLREAWAASESIVREMARLLSEREIPLVAAVVPYKHTFLTAWQRFDRNPDKPFRADHGTARFESILAASHVPTVSLRQRILASGMQPADFFRTTDSHFDAYGHFRTAAWILELLHAESLTAVEPPAVEFRGGDLISSAPQTVRITGLDQPRQPRRHGPAWRAVDGSAASLVFAAQGDQGMTLRFRLTGLGDRTVSVRVNGVDTLTSSPTDGTLENASEFTSHSGRNQIDFTFRSAVRDEAASSTQGRPRGQAPEPRFEQLVVGLEDASN